MKLPNNSKAVVNEDKIKDYILNRSHPDGSHKAKYFESFGFNVNHSDILSESLIEHSIENDVIKVIETNYGTKYIVEGKIKTPDKRNPKVRTIWFIESNENIPKFITVYPRK